MGGTSQAPSLWPSGIGPHLYWDGTGSLGTYDFTQKNVLIKHRKYAAIGGSAR